MGRKVATTRRPGVGQSDDKTGEAPAGTAHANFPEMSPVYLSFLS
jgi:hypothetical protein